MAKATEAQRQRFGRALGAAMRVARREELIPHGAKPDQWLAQKVGMTPQAIRNYVNGIREPKSQAVVEDLEDALELPRHKLGQMLGYGPAPTSISPVLADQLNIIEAQATGHPGWNVVENIHRNARQVREVDERLTALEETFAEIRRVVQVLADRAAQ